MTAFVKTKKAGHLPRLHLFHVKYNCTPNLHMEVQRQSRKSCKTALLHDVTSERQDKSIGESI
jgi:hypothetical protein